MPHFAGWTAAALAGLAAVVVTAIFTGCAASPTDGSASDPNAGLLRDFLDGKYDGAGHPLNARVTEAKTICANAGAVTDSVVALSSSCTARIA
ncbi:MAG: hypothetical protein ABJE66_09345, partial [Deltaproteobacteria bacterium]